MNKDTLESKKAVVAQVSDAIKNSKSMVIVEYRGLTVAKISELRKSLKAVHATFNVYKNTLVTRASDELGHADLNQYLSGSNAYIFCPEVTDAPKVLVKFAKKNEKLVIKAGLIEGKVMDADGIKAVASIPSREGLLSMFLSCLQAPIRNFACTVKAVADSRN